MALLLGLSSLRKAWLLWAMLCRGTGQLTRIQVYPCQGLGCLIPVLLIYEDVCQLLPDGCHLLLVAHHPWLQLLQCATRNDAGLQEAYQVRGKAPGSHVQQFYNACLDIQLVSGHHLTKVI